LFSCATKPTRRFSMLRNRLAGFVEWKTGKPARRFCSQCATQPSRRFRSHRRVTIYTRYAWIHNHICQTLSISLTFNIAILLKQFAHHCICIGGELITTQEILRRQSTYMYKTMHFSPIVMNRLEQHLVLPSSMTTEP